jgi:hypothetical protein
MTAEIAARGEIFVVPDRVAAERVIRIVPQGALILPLTPVASAALARAGLKCIDPLSRYSDCGQLRTVAAVKHAREQMMRVAATVPEWTATHREIVTELFNRAAYTSHRLWLTLGAIGPWYIPIRAGYRPRLYEERIAAFEALLDYMFVPVVADHASTLAARAPPCPRFYRGLRNILLRHIARRQSVVIAGAAKGMFGLPNYLKKPPVNARLVLATSAEGNWKDYARLLRAGARSLASAAIVDVVLSPSSRAPMDATADRLIGAITNRPIASGFDRYRTLLAKRLGSAAPLIRDAESIVAACRPKHFLSAEISRQSEWALAEACGRAGVLRWVVGRNSHAPPLRRTDRDAISGYYSARYPEGLVDRHIVWSPHGKAAARAVLPESRGSDICAIKAMPVEREELRAVHGSQHRRVLVADSFSTLWFPHNWIFQTSHEFLVGLRALIEAIEKIPRAELIVRAKAKLELDLDSYHALLPSSERATIKIRDVPMRTDLQQSTLLVAIRSTTLEEALHMRRPVLLWGGTTRYRYLAARTEPPTANDRAAVYAANSAADLARLLPAILDAHEGRPLTDAEIAEHVWQGNVPTAAEFTRHFIEPAVNQDQIGKAARRIA